MTANDGRPPRRRGGVGQDRSGRAAPGAGAAGQRRGPAADRQPPVQPATYRRPSPQRRTIGPDPEIASPEDSDPSLLADDVRAELRTLSADNAERVGRHLVAAGLLLEEDPVRALSHAQAARRTAARLPAVREAVGLAAYLSGQWQVALTELRAVRRMTGDSRHLPLLADCERGLGRPDRALVLARSSEAAQLGRAERVELRIVEAGARRDLGQLEAALNVLQDAGLASEQAAGWSIRLWYAYADTLLAAGRPDEARNWFEAVVGADEDELTDAADRIAALDGETTADGA